jgi:hypothetical protein
MNPTKMAQQAFSDFRTAILHQGGPAPAIGGVVKPFKPGGTDSHCPLQDKTTADVQDTPTVVQTLDMH